MNSLRRNSPESETDKLNPRWVIVSVSFFASLSLQGSVQFGARRMVSDKQAVPLFPVARRLKSAAGRVLKSEPYSGVICRSTIPDFPG